MDDMNQFPDKVHSTIEHVDPPHVKLNDSASKSTYKPTISSLDVSVAFPESAQSSSFNISMDNALSTVVSNTMLDMIFSDPSNAGSNPEPLCKFVFKLNLVMVPNDDGAIGSIRKEKAERCMKLWEAICSSCEQDPCVILEDAVRYSAIASKMINAGKQNNEVHHHLY